MTALAAAAILVELFTSEGCSSCPPADAVLSGLHQKQPAPGVQLIVLSEHVDYWNSLGWKDPFSDAEFSDRQDRYGSRIYTPQAIVDGRIDVLGSDEGAIVRAAKAAALEPHGKVVVTPGARKVHVAVAELPPHGSARLFVATLEDGLVSKVERGENAGRTLTHSAVVRALQAVATIPSSVNDWAADVDLPRNAAWGQTRIVAFVQDERSRRILAAGAP